jgi:hypothetical protein
LIIAAPASPSPPKRGANNPRLLDNYLTKKDFIFDGVKVGFNSFDVSRAASVAQVIDLV